MHEWLYKQRRNTDIAKWLYQRLFADYTQYKSLDDYLQDPSITTQAIHTIIIGDTIPDLESDRAFVSLDTRSREIRHEKIHLSDTMTVIRHYESSVGDEYFISIETAQGYLYGFTRLLLPKEGETIDYPWLGKSTALIRELHVYGQVAGLSSVEWESRKTQHTGVGKSVMAIAEKIASYTDYQRLSVIAGIGVRDYYRKLSYILEWTYMVKELRM
jgi:histone acetyltransferase (RNA polymerase elongator complex component)